MLDIFICRYIESLSPKYYSFI